MKNTLMLCALFITSIAFAQNKTAEKYAATITPAALKEKLTIIAGAAMEGRETATPGQKKAAAYIEAYLKKLACSQAHQMVISLPFPCTRIRFFLQRFASMAARLR